MSIFVPVSLGELVDKITILEIKSEKIKNQDALLNVQKELLALTCVHCPTVDAEIIRELKTINEKIWEIEDGVRECEHVNMFDNHFIELARSVYINNDKRAAIKRKINEMYQSEYKEEKGYINY